jgi:pilus assembly protein Flp/PilA
VGLSHVCYRGIETPPPHSEFSELSQFACPEFVDYPFPRCRFRLSAKGQKMARLVRSVVRFVNDESGPTAVEYAVMLALIIVVCIAAISVLGSNANNTFNEAATTLNSAS